MFTRTFLLDTWTRVPFHRTKLKHEKYGTKLFLPSILFYPQNFWSSPLRRLLLLVPSVK
jgi:hypothetical protein